MVALTDLTFWCLLAGAAVALELLSGTFYMLMLAIGPAAAALTAYAGASMSVQMSTAAVVGGGAVAIWRVWRSRRPTGPAANADHNVNLDIGQSVQVDAWEPDGTSTVQYRGATWSVVLAPGTVPGIGRHRVCQVVGSQLVIEKI